MSCSSLGETHQSFFLVFCSSLASISSSRWSCITFWHERWCCEATGIEFLVTELAAAFWSRFGHMHSGMCAMRIHMYRIWWLVVATEAMTSVIDGGIGIGCDSTQLWPCCHITCDQQRSSPPASQWVTVTMGLRKSLTQFASDGKLIVSLSQT